MTKNRMLLWITRAMGAVILIGLALIYVGADMAVKPLWIVGIAVFVAGAVVMLYIRFIMSRPDKGLVRRWQAYLTLKEDEITDYAAELDIVNSNYKSDGSKNKNTFDKPMINNVKSFCDFSVLQSGDIYYGCMVQANNMLFEPPKHINEMTLPAVYIYSRDEYYKSNPKALTDIAEELYKNKYNNSLRFETLYQFNEKLDEELTGGREVFMTDILVHRDHLPLGVLGGLRIMPIIANPQASRSAFVVDCKYWTNKLIYAYIHTGIDGVDDDPPDTYGEPFAQTSDKTDKK